MYFSNACSFEMRDELTSSRRCHSKILFFKFQGLCWLFQYLELLVDIVRKLVCLLQKVFSFSEDLQCFLFHLTDCRPLPLQVNKPGCVTATCTILTVICQTELAKFWLWNFSVFKYSSFSCFIEAVFFRRGLELHFPGSVSPFWHIKLHIGYFLNPFISELI